MDNVVLIVGAGRGSRFVSSHDLPKQYMCIGGVSILRMCIQNILESGKIDNICVVIHKDDVDLYKNSVEGLDILPYVLGGENRQESVKNGLNFLKQYGVKNVLIHDAARPFVDKRLINALCVEIQDKDAVLPAVMVTDTIKKCNNDKVLWTVDRSNLWRAQTPQAFKFDVILDLHEKYKDQLFTDDASLAEYAGVDVKIIPGSDDNIKITTDRDFASAKKYLENKNSIFYDIRVGFGYDIHRFCDNGKDLILGGIKIDSDKKIESHSDGDCLIHAICDAILGASGLGDIGEHFNDKDPRYANIDSCKLLKIVRTKAYSAGVVVKNLDATIVLEKPKLSEYKDLIQSKIADLLEIDKKSISIKAKTNEKLDALGAEQGVACFVNVLCEFQKMKQ